MVGVVREFSSFLPSVTIRIFAKLRFQYKLRRTLPIQPWFMKPCTLKQSLFPAVLAISLCSLASIPVGTLRAGIINGDFETGGLTGWQLSATSTHPLFDPPYPFPLETSPLGDAVRVGSGLGNDGSHAVELFNRQFGVPELDTFTGPDGHQYTLYRQNYTLTISQDLSLSAGSVVAGWARFASDDEPMFGDYASVAFDQTTVWRYDLAMLDSHGVWTEGPWQTWQFVAPSDGTYRLSLNVYGDDQISCAGYFDNLQVVPEPSALALLSIGALAIATSLRTAPRRLRLRTHKTPRTTPEH